MGGSCKFKAVPITSSHATHHTCSHTSLLANTRPPSCVRTMLYNAAVVHRLEANTLNITKTHARTHCVRNTRDLQHAADLQASLLHVRAMRIKASHTCCIKIVSCHTLPHKMAQTGTRGRWLPLTHSCARRRAPICCRPILDKQLLSDCQRSKVTPNSSSAMTARKPEASDRRQWHGPSQPAHHARGADTVGWRLHRSEQPGSIIRSVTCHVPRVTRFAYVFSHFRKS
jgi:hypothetical protein